MCSFQVVMRGYDRRQVDELVARIDGASTPMLPGRSLARLLAAPPPARPWLPAGNCGFLRDNRLCRVSRDGNEACWLAPPGPQGSSVTLAAGDLEDYLPYGDFLRL